MEYVKVSHFKKGFDHHVLFEQLDLLFEKGTLSAVVGESGSGKSTLLNILGLLEKADEGTVEYEGYGMVKMNSAAASRLLRYEIGYLFQNYALIDQKSVSYNLDLALAYRKDKKQKEELKKQALASVHLDEEILSKKVFALSGGEQQRVAMARLLLKPCNLILADEPTGNLDEGNRDEIIKLLKELARSGKIVIVVTHDLSIAKQCDQMIRLD